MTTSSVLRTGQRYHIDASEFVFEALRHTQELLGRGDLPQSGNREGDALDDEQVHISGPELLEGIRELGLKRYGLMARYVFSSWGVRTTEDFGRIVFDLVDQGKMRKTDRDQLSDFYDVYDFEQALDRDYRCPTDLALVA
jgi:uncharacterized repeat protein (TIGR04138 family)